MGWIGKNALLVTPETEAPLEIGEVIDESHCGACRACVARCPAQAIKGVFWNPSVGREALFSKEECEKKMHELVKDQRGITVDLCGQCFVVCPYSWRQRPDVGNGLD